MTTPFENHALTGTGSCGCHQQVLAGLTENPGGLPAGAIAFADFKNGTYYYGGNDLDDFLMENVNWGSFDPVTDVVPGSGIGECGPWMAPAITTELLASGFIVVATLGSIPDDTAPQFGASVMEGDFDRWTEVVVFRNNEATSRIRNDDSGIVPISQFLVDGANKVAIEFTDTLAAVSTNGSAVDDEVATAAAFDGIGFGFGGSGEDGFLEQLVFYPSGFAALNTLSV